VTGDDASDAAAARGARRGRVLTALDGALALMAVLLVTQMWLLTATLESVLAGHHGAAVPGALLSAVLFAGCATLLAFVRRLDRRM
jgi:predicted Co/Zn/Cd cation transporter (cation efflux family)